MKEKSRSEKMTYGWVRAEVLGGLINGVVFMALCFNILIEAIQRFFKVEEITQPVLLLIVASVGLLFNVIGLVVFAGHASAGHSHGHSHSHKETPKSEEVAPLENEKEHSNYYLNENVLICRYNNAFRVLARPWRRFWLNRCHWKRSVYLAYRLFLAILRRSYS